MVRCVARVIWLAPGWVLALACAQGADAEGENFGFNPASAGATSDGDGSTGSGSDGGGGKESSGDGVADSSDSGPPSMDTGAVDTGGADGSTGESMGSTGSDDGTGMMCQNDLTCASATPIGGVAGDEGSAALVVSGDTPTWMSFQVSENSSDVFGEEVSFTATLQSPATADFDLFVFRGPEGGSSGCGGSPGQSTNAGASDSVHMSWGEGAVANNTDDGAWVAVEVRAKNGTCDPGAEWTLTVQGDT